jgi:predicted dehydrogenase
VEKPLTVSAVATAAISDELAAGPDIRVVHNYLHHSDVSTAADVLRASGVGDVRLIRLKLVEAGHFPGAGPDPDWRRRPTGIGGGCLADNSYHWLYVAEFLAGSPIVGAVGIVGAADDDRAENIASRTLRHRNGVVTVVLTGWCAPAARDVLEVHGTTGSLALLGQGSGVVLTDSRRARPVAPIDVRDSFARMYEGLGLGLDRGALPGATLTENRRPLRIIDHLYLTAGSAPVLPP